MLYIITIIFIMHLLYRYYYRPLLWIIHSTTTTQLTISERASFGMMNGPRIRRGEKLRKILPLLCLLTLEGGFPSHPSTPSPERLLRS